MNKQIKITIGPMGEFKHEVFGMKGAKCVDATKFLDQAMAAGDGEMTQVMKPEWHETENETVVQEINAGW